MREFLSRYPGAKLVSFALIDRTVPAGTPPASVRVRFASQDIPYGADCILDVPTLDELRLALQLSQATLPPETNEQLAHRLARAALEAGYRHIEITRPGLAPQRHRIRHALHVLHGFAKVDPRGALRDQRQTLVELVEGAARLHADWVAKGVITNPEYALDAAVLNVLNTFRSRFPEHQPLPPLDRIQNAVVACANALARGRPKKSASRTRPRKWPALAALCTAAGMRQRPAELRTEALKYRRDRAKE